MVGLGLAPGPVVPLLPLLMPAAHHTQGQGSEGGGSQGGDSTAHLQSRADSCPPEKAPSPPAEGLRVARVGTRDWTAPRVGTPGWTEGRLKSEGVQAREGGRRGGNGAPPPGGSEGPGLWPSAHGEPVPAPPTACASRGLHTPSCVPAVRRPPGAAARWHCSR